MDGQRLLAEQNPTYEPELVELRGAARALALNFLQGGIEGQQGRDWPLSGAGWDHQRVRQTLLLHPLAASAV